MKKIICTSILALVLFSCNENEIDRNITKRDVKSIKQTFEKKELASINKEVNIKSILQKNISARGVEKSLKEFEKDALDYYKELVQTLEGDSLKKLNNFIEKGGQIKLNYGVSYDVPNGSLSEEALESMRNKSYVDLAIDINTDKENRARITNLKEISQLIEEGLTPPMVEYANERIALKGQDDLGSVSIKTLVKTYLNSGNINEAKKILAENGVEISDVNLRMYGDYIGSSKDQPLTKSSGGTGYSERPLPGFEDYSDFDDGDILIGRISKGVPGHFSHLGFFDQRKHDKQASNGRIPIDRYCILTANPKSGKNDDKDYQPDRTSGVTCYDKVRVFTHSADCVRAWPIQYSRSKAENAINKARTYYDKKAKYGYLLFNKKDRDQEYTKKMYCSRVAWLGWKSQGVDIECDDDIREKYKFLNCIYPDNVYNACLKTTIKKTLKILWWSKVKIKVYEPKNIHHKRVVRW